EWANGKRMKSSSVEIKWNVLSLCSRYLVTLWLLGVMGLAAVACRFMICA
nr:RNA polymerase II elongation factor ELL3 isoform 1 [Tanacetum cinerariifolium]